MKEKLRNKKIVYTIIGIVSVLLVALAVTYAYWLVTKTQTGENVISSACLDISISGEKNDIELTNQFPMSDEDGMKLVPYEFTVTNNCNTSVDYQIALEATGDSSNALKGTSLKVALNDTVSLLSNNAEVETTIEGAYESRRLGFSRLSAKGIDGSSDTYELRIWIAEDAPISEMRKTFKSRISVTIGQGIESTYEEGTVAYSILANVGGTGTISEISVVSTEMITATGNVYMSTSSNYHYGTEVTYDASEGKYTLGGTLVQAKTSECRSGTKTCGKYTLKQTTSTATSAILYEVIDFQSSGNYVTANTISYTTEFNKATTASDAGVYKTQDDLGTSYYFRGAATNNYVEFGMWSESLYTYEACDDWGEGEECYYDYYPSLESCEFEGYSICKKLKYADEGDSMYWRIVRINGDGTIRLIYDGTEKAENGSAHTAIIGRTVYNTEDNDAKYVGYTYESTDAEGATIQADSTIKSVVDAWYEKHLETTYGTYIADSIFCNDRQVTSESEEYVRFASFDRLRNNKTPVLTCANKSDRYTVNDTTNGNGLLSNPVGLITADEAMMAGGVGETSNQSYYLYSGEYYWTSSPNEWHDLDVACILNVSGEGALNYDGPLYYNHIGVRPVINLKADVKFTGDGTIDNPYKIVTE